MRALLLLAIILGSLISQCAPEALTDGLPEATLRRLSLDGEKYIEEDVKRALFGVKQMKEVMEKNEEKHVNLMRSLRHSNEKKKMAVQLAGEVQQKLGEAEQQCKESLKASWEECRPCLEDVCKTFYTSTCRRGFSTFSFKVEDFFKKTSALFQLEDGQSLVQSQNQENPDAEMMLVEDSFRQLQHRVSVLYEKSMELVNNMRRKFNCHFHDAFVANPKPKHILPAPDILDAEFLKGIGLEEVLDSFFDFGKSVLEEFSSVITEVFEDLQDAVQKDSELLEGTDVFPSWDMIQSKKLCRDLRRQTSECWQLQGQCESCQRTVTQECPSVWELHRELNEASDLLSVSSQQYQDVLQIVQQHTDETFSWLSDMVSRFSWVADLANCTAGSDSVFNVAAVIPPKQFHDSVPAKNTMVKVNVLNSPTFTLNVPADLEVRDPAFIQHVARKAMDIYKQMVRNGNIEA